MDMLPVEIVLHPSWWHHQTGLTFDEDFFFHPKKRVEAERLMERALYERWGQYGLGQDHAVDRPQIGAVHLAAGFLLSEMLGCRIEYQADAAPQVLEAHADAPVIKPEQAFQSPAFKRFVDLTEDLKRQYGYITGDVNWSGILNLALDVRGQPLFLDLRDKPEQVSALFTEIAGVIQKFVAGFAAETGSSSISVNRTVRHLAAPVFLHSECSHTMISAKDYERYLLPYDIAWSRACRPFGIHYCGSDPHRHAKAFAQIPHLDFLDVGWGGDIKHLRQHLPQTFFNIRLSPVELVTQTPDEIRQTITTLVNDSGNPWLTGICCINMDQQVTDDKITAIFETVAHFRQTYRVNLQE